MGDAGAMRVHNWSDTYTFTAARIHRPRSVEDLRAIVAAAPKLRAIGARHSFNALADSAELVDLCDLDLPIEIDAPARQVTVPAATNYGALAARLHAEGWALHNMGSLPHITVAGATATGTHGSGDGHGNLSTAVAAMELVRADGTLATVRRGDADFPGMVVGLGAFGIATRMTLDIRPTYMLRQDAWHQLPWERVIDDLDAIMSAAYSVSLMTAWSRPTVDRVWAKTLVTGAGGEGADFARVGALAAPHPGTRDDEAALNRLTAFGSAGPWSERLCHFRPEAEPGPLAQIQSEYMLPRRNAVAAIRRMRAMASQIDELLITTEIRSMQGDDLWLSPSYGEDAIALHFTFVREAEPVAALTRDIEAALLPLGARPHWGKLMHAEAAALATLYPRMADFRALARRWDAGGKFRNAFLERHVFGG